MTPPNNLVYCNIIYMNDTHIAKYSYLINGKKTWRVWELYFLRFSWWYFTPLGGRHLTNQQMTLILWQFKTFCCSPKFVFLCSKSNQRGEIIPAEVSDVLHEGKVIAQRYWFLSEVYISLRRDYISLPKMCTNRSHYTVFVCVVVFTLFW